MEMRNIKADQIIEDVEGIHLGTVDHLDGEYIKLKRTDSPDGKHHWIPVSWAESLEGNCLILNKSEAEFQEGLLDESPLKTAV